MSAVASDIFAGLRHTLPKVDVEAIVGQAGALLEVGALLAGAGLIAYGAHMAWPPAGFLVGGVQLIAGVILRARGR